MFAEKASQGQGLGKEALLCMMHYGQSFGFLALLFSCNEVIPDSS